MRLCKQDKQYLIIIYVIWKLLAYYSDFFVMEVPTDATKLPIKLWVDSNNVTHLIVEVPSIRTPDPYYQGDSMKTIFNEYLNVVLLPKCKELKPFVGGHLLSDKVDCLYCVEAFVLTTGYTYIDFIFVDNMQAFRLVKEDNKVTVTI